MGEGERILARLLEQVARPHPIDEELPADLQASLWQLGVPCDGSTPRQDVVALLWARRRSMLDAIGPSAA
jgi:hypothetical protein